MMAWTECSSEAVEEVQGIQEVQIPRRQWIARATDAATDAVLWLRMLEQEYEVFSCVLFAVVFFAIAWFGLWLGETE